jgi:crotonobetainyl-CoA:carnitine CoA-transferase CaiB-like acyl-CoA transferase
VGKPAPPPLLGEHTEEVLGELGRSREEVEALAARGVVRLGSAPP